MVEYSVTIVRQGVGCEDIASHSIKLSEADITQLRNTSTDFHKRISELEYVVLTQALISLRSLERAVEASKTAQDGEKTV